MKQDIYTLCKNPHIGLVTLGSIRDLETTARQVRASANCGYLIVDLTRIASSLDVAAVTAAFAARNCEPADIVLVWGRGLVPVCLQSTLPSVELVADALALVHRWIAKSAYLDMAGGVLALH